MILALFPVRESSPSVSYRLVVFKIFEDAQLVLALLPERERLLSSPICNSERELFIYFFINYWGFPSDISHVIIYGLVRNNV